MGKGSAVDCLDRSLSFRLSVRRFPSHQLFCIVLSHCHISHSLVPARFLELACLVCHFQAVCIFTHGYLVVAFLPSLVCESPDLGINKDSRVSIRRSGDRLYTGYSGCLGCIGAEPSTDRDTK